MKTSRASLLAISAALLGAITTHLSWVLREAEQEKAEPSRIARDVECEPRVEHVCQGAPAPVIAPPGGRAEPVLAEPQPALTPPPSMLGQAGGWNPLAQLSSEQRKIMIRHRYGELLRELAVPQSERERLLEVLSAHEARRPSVPNRGPGSTHDAEALASRERAEIAAVIGDEKAATFEQLKSTVSLRAEVRRVRDQLDEAGEPMTAEQYRALIGAMSDWVAERDDMFREKAAGVLERAQLKTLDEGRSCAKPCARSSAPHSRRCARKLGPVDSARSKPSRETQDTQRDGADLACAVRDPTISRDRARRRVVSATCACKCGKGLCCGSSRSATFALQNVASGTSLPSLPSPDEMLVRASVRRLSCVVCPWFGLSPCFCSPLVAVPMPTASPREIPRTPCAGSGPRDQARTARSRM